MKYLFMLLFVSCILGKALAQPADSAAVAEFLKIDEGNGHPYALIAGGSKGIGYGLAEALAKRKFNLVLIARHWDSLAAAKTKLEAVYGIHVELLSYDLSKEESAGAIAAWCTERGLPLKILCNVAGAGGARDFLHTTIDTLRTMVRLNIESCMTLTLQLLPLLEQNTPAYILNVSSMAGFAPIPIKNIYAATKSAVMFFSYALRYQLKNKNISVSCLAPGPVYTKPEIVAETKKQLGGLGDKMALSPHKVGEMAVRKTLRGKMMIVPGFLANMMSQFLRIFPRGFSATVYDKLGKE